jgi:N-acetylmuramoyl-L-alanine amidase
MLKAPRALNSTSNPRAIKHIVLHCTATSRQSTLDEILTYWRTGRGWDRPGYHYLVTASGQLLELYPESEPTWGVRAINANAIHLTYIGGIGLNGVGKDTRTPEQLQVMESQLKSLLARYPLAVVSGHYHHQAKACPSFDVPGWCRFIGIPEARITPLKVMAPVASIVPKA